MYTCTREWGMGGVKLSECVRFTVTQCAYVFMGVGVCVCAHVSVCMHVIYRFNHSFMPICIYK